MVELLRREVRLLHQLTLPRGGDQFFPVCVGRSSSMLLTTLRGRSMRGFPWSSILRNACIKCACSTSERLFRVSGDIKDEFEWGFRD